MNFDDDIQKVKSVGSKTVEVLKKLSIESVSDLLDFLPRTYEDRSSFVNIEDIQESGDFVIKGVLKENINTIRTKLHISKGTIVDDTGEIKVIWYNRPYIKNTLKPFCEYTFIGKCKKEGKHMVMYSPDFEEEDKTVRLNSNRIVPVYSLSRHITQKKFRTIIHNALQEIPSAIDFFPLKILQKYNLCSKDFAIHNIHFPKDEEAFFKARRRLVFEELFLMQSNLITIKSLSDKATKIFGLDTNDENILKMFPFKLTNAQKKVLEDIKKDFNSEKAMNRLIQGDVGSGKTAVAMVASYIMCNNGYQVVMMAPTEVLARQHYEGFAKIFEPLGIKVVFLAGSLTPKNKRLVYEEIKENDSQIIIGTNAVIQEKAIYKNLGLVITDEQHRFGVNQRMTLQNKGDNPHVLVMTATPIPRTLGLVLYGDLNVSVIDELPPNRKYIDTYSVNSNYLTRIYNFIEKEILSGRQCYVICPLIEENETMDLTSVMTYTEELKKTFSNRNVECLHGKMKQSQKDDLMYRFANKEIDILVSTTVIEVGINVPNATVMLIKNSERFGLSALHQLRGRVGRGEHKSYCILVTDSKNENTKERMKIISSTNDGFVIAEKDLQLRGQGDFFGTKQHGLPEFKIANLFTDVTILEEVQNLIKDIENNNFLEEKEKKVLNMHINNFREQFYKEIIL